jgi:branched-chain amino acid transport system substrate-binding protein
VKVRVRVSLVLAICVAAVALTSTIVSGQAGGRAGPQVPPPPGFQVKVALILPLSGGAQYWGERTRDGALLAIQEAQAAGWDVQTVLADSECDGEAAVDAANQVIFTDTVKYIVGAVCSSASIPISDIAEANQVVQISPVSTDPRVTTHDDGTNKEYVFRACFLNPFQGQVMAAVARDLGATTAAVMYDEGDDYVSGLAEYFRSAFEGMGGSVPVYEAYTSAVHDFSGILSTVAAADPDVLFLPEYYSRVNEIAEQADALGIQARFLGADGWDSPDLRFDLLEGAYFSTHFWAGDPRQVVVDFVQAYSTTYGTQPDTFAALGYDATGILLQAIAEAGVDDPSVVKDEMAGIAYEGVTDKIAFDEFGDPIKGAAIVAVEGGQTSFFKWVAPVSRLVATNDSPTEWPQTTTLTATVSTGSDVAYAWTLGDGTTASGQTVTHTYPAPGDFTAVVTASNRFNSITTTTTVKVIGYRVFLPVVMRQATSLGESLRPRSMP